MVERSRIGSWLLVASLSGALYSCGKSKIALPTGEISRERKDDSKPLAPEPTVIPPVVVTGSFLSGVMVDASGAILPDTSFQIEKNGLTVQTASDGQFYLPVEKIPAGKVDLRIEKNAAVVHVTLSLPSDVASLIEASRSRGGKPAELGRSLGIEVPELSDSAWNSSTRVAVATFSIPRLSSQEKFFVENKFAFAVESPLPVSASQGNVSITGRCVTGAEILVTGDINSSPVVSCSNNVFNLSVDLNGHDGEKLVLLTHRLPSGSYVTQILPLHKDTTPPMLRISAPDVAVAGPSSTVSHVVKIEDVNDGASGIATVLSNELFKNQVQIDSTGGATCSTVNVTGAGLSERTVSVSGCSGTGEARLRIVASPSAVATDASGNASLQTDADFTFQITAATPPVENPPAIGSIPAMKLFSQSGKELVFTISDPDSISQIDCTSDRLALTTTPADLLKPISWKLASASGNQRVCKGFIEIASNQLDSVPSSFSLNLQVTDTTGRSSAVRTVPVSILDTSKTALLYHFSSLGNASAYNSVDGMNYSNAFTDALNNTSYSANGAFGNALNLSKGVHGLVDSIVHSLWRRRATFEVFLKTSQDTSDRPVLLVGKDESWKIEFMNESSSGGRLTGIIFSVLGDDSWKSVSCIGKGFSKNANGYTHIAATFDEGAMKLFAHGSLCGSATSGLKAIPASASLLILGPEVIGQIDELRISRFIRYTTDFTPPAAELPAD
jgi:hypothetical protein